jgi:hypothetical protein
MAIAKGEIFFIDIDVSLIGFKGDMRVLLEPVLWFDGANLNRNSEEFKKTDKKIIGNVLESNGNVPNELMSCSTMIGIAVGRNRKQYLNMIQAQISDEELRLVFYDAMSCHGLNKMSEKVFKRNLDEENFLENIGEMSLLSRNHHRVSCRMINIDALSTN